MIPPVSDPAGHRDSELRPNATYTAVVHGRCLTIQFTGELDSSTSEPLCDRIRSMTAARECDVVVDLTKVEFCDTAAVRSFARLAATPRGGTFRLIGARPHIAWLINFHGAGHLMSHNE